MKNKKNILLVVAATISVILMNIGCSTTSTLIADKSGATLWGENCVRCHNAPSPTDYNDDQWSLIGEHMKVRANITDDEQSKIVEFLKSAN